MATIQSLMKQARDRLRDSTVTDTPDLDVRLLMCYVLGCNTADLIARSNDVLTVEQENNFSAMMDQRVTGRPVSKITGLREFWGRDFAVNDHTLDPRSDSETLIDAVLRRTGAMRDRPIRILDLGTGTGCLLLTLLYECPNAVGVGVDISTDALQMAKQNAERHGLTGRVIFVQSDWFDGVDGLYDIIISNPPYIRRSVIDGLELGVKGFDPILALDGGPDGLDAYKKIFSSALTFLSTDGFVALEIGYDQSDDVIRLGGESGFHGVESYADLGGRDRVVLCAVGIKGKK